MDKNQHTRILEKFKFNNQPIYTTDMGAAYCGDFLNLLPQLPGTSLDLVRTSPPFACEKNKEYLAASALRFLEKGCLKGE